MSNILSQAGLKYLLIYEKSGTGWGVAAKTLNEARELIREAIDFHIEGMREHGDEAPVRSATTEYITV